MAFQVLIHDSTATFLRERLAQSGDSPIPAVQSSLKMSGHLITMRAINGKLVIAAKNSSENSYTLTAHLLLQGMLGPEGVARLVGDMEMRNICVSFECITSFNGDHGYPHRTGLDILLCTAVHTLREGASEPWSYVPLYGFCRRHLLPCTQTLLALDPPAAQRVFAAYSEMRHHFGPQASQFEAFLASTVDSGLAVGLDCLPHSLISDVVEGLVTRSVLLSRAEAEQLVRLAELPPLPLGLPKLNKVSRELREWVARTCNGPVLTEEAAKERFASEPSQLPVYRLVRGPRKRLLEKQKKAEGSKEGAHAAGGAAAATDSARASRETSAGDSVGTEGAASADMDVDDSAVDVAASVTTGVKAKATEQPEQQGKRQKKKRMPKGHEAAHAGGPGAGSAAAAAETNGSYSEYRKGPALGRDKEPMDIEGEGGGGHDDSEAQEEDDDDEGEAGESGSAAEKIRTVGPGPGELLESLFSNPADDGSTKFVLDTIRTMRKLETNAFFILYESAPSPPAAATGGGGAQAGDLGADAKAPELQLLFVHVPGDSSHLAFHNYAASHPDAGVLYRGHVLRLQRRGDGRWAASVFMNFYPKFENARNSEAAQMIHALWEEGKAGDIAKFKLSYYMYATMCARRLVEELSKAKTKANAKKKGKGKAGAETLQVSEYFEACRKRLRSWGMSPAQITPFYARLTRWWTWLEAAKRDGRKVTSERFLDEFMPFLDEEERMQGAVDDLLVESGPLNVPVFVMAQANGKHGTPVGYASALAALLGAPLLTAEIGAKGNRARMENAYRSCVLCLNGLESGKSVRFKLPGKDSALLQECVCVFDPQAPARAESREEQVNLEKWLGAAKRGGCLMLNPEAHTPAEAAEQLRRLPELREPTLIVPVGIPGCGKSRLARELETRIGVTVVSSDQVRVDNGDTGKGKPTKGTTNKFKAAMEEAMRPRRASVRGDGSASAPLVPDEPPLLAVFRDKNLPNPGDYNGVFEAEGGNGLPICIAFGFSGMTPAGAAALDALPPLTDWELATCMHRVLNRQHIGNVDSEHPQALAIVLSFAAMLMSADKTRGRFIERLNDLCGSASRVLHVPICSDAQFLQVLPADVKEPLYLGLKAHREHSKCHSKKEVELPMVQGLPWEQCMREAIQRHVNDITAVAYHETNPEFVAALNAVVSRVQELCTGVLPPPPPSANGVASSLPPQQRQQRQISLEFRPFFYYELEVPAAEANSALETHFGRQEVDDFLAAHGLSYGWSDKVLHITLAFKARTMNREKLRVIHESLGAEGTATIGALAADARTASLVVDEFEGGLSSTNKHPHVTLALAAGVKPRESNDTLASGTASFLRPRSGSFQLRGIVKGKDL